MGIGTMSFEEYNERIELEGPWQDQCEEPLDVYKTFSRSIRNGRVTGGGHHSDSQKAEATKRLALRDWFVSVRSGDLKTMKKLMAYKRVDVNAREEGSNQTALMYALIYRREDVLKLLLNNPDIRFGHKSSCGFTEMDFAKRYFPEAVPELTQALNGPVKINTPKQEKKSCQKSPKSRQRD